MTESGPKRAETIGVQAGIAEVSADTVTVLVPLHIRRRNGRPRIVLPRSEAHATEQVGQRANETVLRAIARAWGWRRSLEAGEVTTLQDIATAEKITAPYVSRTIRLAYLSPAFLESIVKGGSEVACSTAALADIALDPWAEQN